MQEACGFAGGRGIEGENGGLGDDAIHPAIELAKLREIVLTCEFRAGLQLEKCDSRKRECGRWVGVVPAENGAVWLGFAQFRDDVRVEQKDHSAGGFLIFQSLRDGMGISNRGPDCRTSKRERFLGW